MRGKAKSGLGHYRKSHSAVPLSALASTADFRQSGYRSGGACRSPAVRGKKRCRMHGGAPGSGAPRENRNARKHGLFTKDAIAERRQIQALLGEARKLLEAMK